MTRTWSCVRIRMSGMGLAIERREHQLPDDVVPELDRLARVHVDELGEVGALADEVQPVRRVALGRRSGAVSLVPKMFARDHPEGVLDRRTDARVLESGIAREQALADPQRRRVDALARGPSPPGEARTTASSTGRASVPRSAADLQQPLRLPDPDRRHARAERLERHVVVHAARVQAVVHALEEHVSRSQPGRPGRPGADLVVDRDVVPVSAIRIGREVVPPVACIRTSRSSGAAWLDPNGGARVLGGLQLGLLGEWQVAQVLPAMDRPRVGAGRAPLLAIERARPRRVRQLAPEPARLERPERLGLDRLERLVPVAPTGRGQRARIRLFLGSWVTSASPSASSSGGM